MCVLYAADSSGKVWTEIDRSDVVANTLSERRGCALAALEHDDQ